ncbi:Erp22 protein (plasmid) [Borreliella burgdorferi 29805]|uniref:ErpD n=3 Tax=Borreliella burgdorferi TaxID=139 RepID=Q44791_BORBG|nr:Erp22 protein [Borreliella burgdorferi]AAC34911.1 ErpD [Borreliella burgdorferi]ABL86592.1 ErpD [Borreliella burgdorferi]ACO38246.1 Erp22 protein [Borreliella burgdorferi 29805]ARS31980.1 ErpC protein [Borreliella burgdorferi]ARS32434.1 ErpC protein [Borreliella burgdorferi]
MNQKAFIICAVFALIISCKNYATSKDLKQNPEGKIKGFLDPTKDKITSIGPKVDEVAKKLKQEERELMQGDDPNGSGINPPPTLLENGNDNTLVPIAKSAEQSGDQKEEKSGKVEEKKEKQESKEEKVEEQNQEKKQKKEERNVKEEKQKQEEERQKQQEEARAKAEKEKREREEKQKQEEEKKVKGRIKTLTDKINEINRDIDGIKGQTSIGAEEVRDKITGPIYDDFTDSSSSIRTTWGDLEYEEDLELGRLLKELSEARDSLRTKLNVDNQPYIIDTRSTEPQLKDNVSVSEIKSDLDELKSKLEEVKEYLEDKDNFEEIKEYVAGSEDNYDEED